MGEFVVKEKPSAPSGPSGMSQVATLFPSSSWKFLKSPTL